MSNSDVILSQIRQRLEILYQMVDELEAGGGGGGGGTTNYNNLTNKPAIEGQQLVGNKTASDLGLATTSELNGKVDKVAGSSLMTSAQANKLDGIEAGAEVNVQADWNQANSSADDYIKNKPTLGAAAEKNVDTVPTDGSNNLITSGAVFDAVQGGGGGTTPTYVGAKAFNFPEEYMSVLESHSPFTTSQGLPAQDFSPWFFYSETSSQYYYIAVRTNGTTGPLLYKIAEILKSTRRWTEGAVGVIIDDRSKKEIFKPTALSSTQDLNSISKNGYYFSLDATNNQNSPTTDAFILKHIDSANNRAEQTLITTVQTNPKFYFRGRDNTGWSSWYEITGTIVS